MRVTFHLIGAIVAAVFAAAQAYAADAGDGRVVAQRWCASCHVVSPEQAQARADAPPFPTIARKRSAADLGAFLANPYPRMPDMSLTREEIADLVAFIKSYGLAPGEVPAPAIQKDNPDTPRRG